MLEHNLHPCISEPTRIVNTNKPSLVDNIFVSKINNPTSGNILEKISYDHLPNFVIFEAEITRNKDNNVKIRDMKNFNEKNFTDELSSLNRIDTHLSTNESFNRLHKNFLQTLNKHAPLRYLSKKEIKTSQKPWLTKGILTSIKIKRKLFASYKNTLDDTIYSKYKIYRNLLNTLLRKSKKMHYRSFFTDNSNNIKKTWNEINKILNRKRKTQLNLHLNINGTLTTDKTKISNTFNQYFVNVADNLSKKIPLTNNKYQDYLKNPNKCSFFIKETTPHEINLIIQSLKSSNTTDIFGISTKFVKIASTAIEAILASIYNKSINEGIFPDAMKLAKILPIHKGDSKFIVSNYRPISLLPILSKIFEKLMYNRLIEFINKNNILTPNQFGFQKNKSTEMAVNTIINNVINSFEKKETAYCIFLDFAKAFDTVNHQILIKKLEYYGIRGTPLTGSKTTCMTGNSVQKLVILFLILITSNAVSLKAVCWDLFFSSYTLMT